MRITNILSTLHVKYATLVTFPVTVIRFFLGDDNASCTVTSGALKYPSIAFLSTSNGGVTKTCYKNRLYSV